MVVLVWQQIVAVFPCFPFFTTSSEVDHLYPSLSSGDGSATVLAQGYWSCTLFFHLGDNWFFVVVVLRYPSFSSGNGHPMDWVFLLSLAADRGCGIVMALNLLHLNNSVVGSLFSVLPSLLQRWIICIRCYFLVLDLCWCSSGGGSLRPSPTNSFFRSFPFVAIAGSLR